MYFVCSTHYDDELFFVFEEFTTDEPCTLGEHAPILTNGLVSTKHSNAPVHVRDIVSMTIQDQDFESASGDLGSDIEIVL